MSCTAYCAMGVLNVWYLDKQGDETYIMTPIIMTICFVISNIIIRNYLYEYSVFKRHASLSLSLYVRVCVLFMPARFGAIRNSQYSIYLSIYLCVCVCVCVCLHVCVCA